MTARGKGPGSRDGRQGTDESLRRERIKTDAELAKTRARAETEAAKVVEQARQRAEVTLETARQRADDLLPRDPARAELIAARAEEDAAIAEAGVARDHELVKERSGRERALTALLRAERAATDDGLAVERTLADQALAVRDDFLGMVSHDLRTLLGGIALSAELLASSVDPAPSADTLGHAERIQRFSGRMSRLIGDLLDVVSLDAGALRVVLAPCDAVLLSRETLESFHPSFAAKGITLAATLPDGPVLATCDRDRIAQVLANLLGNALKFTHRRGSVHVGLERQGADVCVSVTDDGPGIPAAERTHIFERFRQLRPDRRGLGLGLFIAKSIVEAHSGRIWVESPPASGTTMRFTLPAT
jgi:signal transduction histidine kinase